MCIFYTLNAQESQHVNDDCFCSIIKNGTIKNLDEHLYEHNQKPCLDAYDIKYVDCQYFLFIFEYAYRYNDSIAFKYLANFITDFYEKNQLVPNTLAHEMIDKFNNQLDSNTQAFISKEKIEYELKYNINISESTDDIYSVICTTFSSKQSNHKNTSLLYQALIKAIKNGEQYGDDIGQRFFLSFIIADQYKDSSAFINMYDEICSFYLKSGIKINDNVFDIIASWLYKLPQNNEKANYKIQRMALYKKEILKNRSACE